MFYLLKGDYRASRLFGLPGKKRFRTSTSKPSAFQVHGDSSNVELAIRESTRAFAAVDEMHQLPDIKGTPMGLISRFRALDFRF